ncbi:MAG: RdgB/HAM1 family non-canonical purine NTP pyrophosphatase [Marinilabiliales bacterium]|nr:MAG: RdgB/HAM1 family non-canonical purine NTP pyrophosphatase [Marinilabiliales bacterium]
MELVFATNNPGKLREIEDLLGSDFRLRSLKDIGFEGDIPETNPTLEENASAKAFFIYNRYSVSCFADDTGLEVEALNNEPGVYSARYAELDGNAVFGSRGELTVANIDKLLRLLKDKNSRKARFRTVISLVLDGAEHLFEGVAPGMIIDERRGAEGFGYDPVFVPEGSSRTFAEMSLGEKNRISHRAIAFRKLVSFLTELRDY